MSKNSTCSSSVIRRMRMVNFSKFSKAREIVRVEVLKYPSLRVSSGVIAPVSTMNSQSEWLLICRITLRMASGS